MKTVTTTLGLACSNIAERIKGVRPKGEPRLRDLEPTAEIRCLVEPRPTYVYRPIATVPKRERRTDGVAPGQRQARLNRHALPLAQPAAPTRANTTGR